MTLTVKNSYERCVYKSVDDRSLSLIASQKWAKNRVPSIIPKYWDEHEYQSVPI